MSKVLTAKDILTTMGKFPAREQLATDEVRANAEKFATSVSEFLQDIGYTGQLTASSGYRPPAVNASTPGAAPNSNHAKGLAMDFVGQELGKFIRKHKDGAEALRRRGLFMEALESTKSPNGGWTHIDHGKRMDRTNREFKP